MKVVPFEDVGSEAWDAFCAQSDDAWFMHSARWLRYTLAYRPELEGQNLSFAIFDQREIQAICPMILEITAVAGGRFGEFAFGSEPGPVPAMRNGLEAKKRGKVLDLVFAQIDGLARDVGGDRCSLRFNALAKSYAVPSVVPFNYLVKYRYLEYCLYTQVLDLADDEDAILRSMRKGHKHSVKKAIKEFAIEVFDQENITPEVFAAYQDLHAKASGRKTRAQITFDLMLGWIREGVAALCGASLDGKYVGFALVIVYKDGSLYASACNDPDAEGYSIGHGLQWELIRYLKERGIRRYDMGLQFWSNQLHYAPNPKEVAISNFKRGFGGVTVPVFCSERFYNADLCKRVLGERVQVYCASQFAEGEQDS
jgi:hypothetical protein